MACEVRGEKQTSTDPFLLQVQQLFSQKALEWQFDEQTCSDNETGESSVTIEDSGNMTHQLMHVNLHFGCCKNAGQFNE